MNKGFANLTRLLSLLFLSCALFACQASPPSDTVPLLPSHTPETVPSHTPETVESEEQQLPAQTQTQSPASILTRTPTIAFDQQVVPPTQPLDQQVVLPTQPQAPTVVLTIEGLTYEEMRSNTPPPPLNLQITPSGNGVRLTWEPATSPYPAHNYSGVIIGYNIYRRTDGEMEPKVYATVETTSFVDGDVAAGVTYYYAVSAVHEGPLEGQKTEELSWPLPYP